MATGHRFGWVAIEKSEGMFSSEYAVILPTADGTKVSFFVDKSLVKEEGGASSLKVRVINAATAQHAARVLLPTETFETATRWVDVNDVRAG